MILAIAQVVLVLIVSKAGFGPKENDSKGLFKVKDTLFSVGASHSIKILSGEGEYPEVVSGATVGNLEARGAPLKGDSYSYLNSRVLAVVVTLDELLWIKRSIISVRAEIWACKGSKLA